MIEHMGGTVSVQSQEGVGTMFEIDLATKQKNLDKESQEAPQNQVQELQADSDLEEEKN